MKFSYKFIRNSKDIEKTSNNFDLYKNPFSTIPEALEEIREGHFVIVMDDENRENEGDLIMSAKLSTPESVAFCVRHTTGILCAPMTAKRAKELQLSPMVYQGNDPNQTAFTISTDSVDTSTGVSAKDRSTTFVQLADEEYKYDHFRRPGHIFPLIARPNGILERRGHTESAVDLCILSGLPPVGLIGEIVNKNGTMKRLMDCVKFGLKYKIKLITIEQLASYRNLQSLQYGILTRVENVELVSQCELPINMNGKDLGQWTLKCFFSHLDGRYHTLVEKGDIKREPYDSVLTRVHSECFTGDIMGSQRCDCREQLFKSLEMISNLGRGVVLYNVGHEGRGIGLANKIMAYQLQQTKNIDTYEANRLLGFKDDLRNYETAKSILKSLGIQKIQLLTSNEEKIKSFGDMVSNIIPIQVSYNKHNKDYLQTKKNRNDINNNLPIIKDFENLKPSLTKSVPINLPIPSISENLIIGIVRTSWNENMVLPLFNAIQKQLLDLKIKFENIKTMLVPGSFEIPYAAKLLSQTCDAVICIGILIKGETMHFEMISSSVAQGLMNLQLKSGVPMINSVLNCITEGQAEARCSNESQLPSSIASTAVYMAGLKNGWDSQNGLVTNVAQPCGN